jgi:hypothetical protein
MNLPKKKDPALTYLNKLGYNVIRMPQESIDPLLLIGRDQDIHPLGPLTDYFDASVPPPPVLPARDAVAVNGQSTDALDCSVGLGILSNALKAFGASAPSLNTAYRSAHAVQFSFGNVQIVSISLTSLGKYLASANLTAGENDPVYRNYFLNPQATTWLIIEVLRSNSVTVTATDSHGVAVGVDLPAIEGIADAKIEIKPSNSSNNAVTFTGPKSLTFGFAVQQIVRNGDRWEMHGAAPSGDIAFAVPGVGGEELDEGERPMIFETGPADCRLDF